MLHELWEDPVDGTLSFLLAGPLCDQARAMLSDQARVVWVVEGVSHVDAMTKYYEHQGWGTYTTDFPEIDNQTYAERGWE